MPPDLKSAWDKYYQLKSKCWTHFNSAEDLERKTLQEYEKVSIF